MFRNPRENASRKSRQTPIKPSTGRPPTPPPSNGNVRPEAMAKSSGPQTVRNNTTPLAHKSTSMLNGSSLRKPGSATARPKNKPNRSILNFFKKVETPADPTGDESLDRGDSLFFGDGDSQDGFSERQKSPTPAGLFDDGDWAVPLGNDTEEAEKRYNERGGSIKRRKPDSDSLFVTDTTISVKNEDNTSLDGRNTGGPSIVQPNNPDTVVNDACTPPPPDFENQNPPEPTSGNVDQIEPAVKKASTKPKSRRGPFMDDSEGEDEEVPNPLDLLSGDYMTRRQSPALAWENTHESPEKDIIEKSPDSGSMDLVRSDIPTLKQEATSLDGFGFDDIEDFDDEFLDGEEAVARRWMEEQERLEMEEAENQEDLGGLEPADDESGITPACPVCNVSFAGVSDSEASVHVNHCLDGNPTPLPSEPSLASKDATPTKPLTSGSNQFQRTARPPKPGQENPFVFGESSSGGSAFSKLMSSHAEDSAWATAAAAENAARGKPSYQRTCPFYKILPGFFICVDAFRYGAVEGCQAYFLSHFHSDHYVGLTSTWCHGPIYCSKVTGNLVRQQLRVNPKWVVDLEFEQTVEVPNTKGVNVTMIPANHCPGSSLFLFTKVVGAGKSPKVQRVLHCGDFRACPEHLQHPLLRPDVKDSISGKTSQQKIDVCYLDTTYLNPKYAFPSQQDVITACGDMCISLSKDVIDTSDSFETMKRERAGAGMTKFIQQGTTSATPAVNPTSNSIVKESDSSLDSEDAKTNSKRRGRLLVVIGTYSIGKERVCLGIAKALNSKIYAPAGKMRICACLEDSELSSRLTSDPHAAQVHMTPLFEIRADTLAEYLSSLSPHFSHVVGFRPTGWNYRPPGSRSVDAPAVSTILHSTSWKSTFTMRDLIPQRGSTRQAQCFGVPYSEHSSFRELSMFCCGLRIEKVIPTVNVGSAKSRERMKTWVDRWMTERRKNGLFDVAQW